MDACFAKNTVKSLLFALIFFSMTVSKAWCGVGQSAVITLVFPPGARATGLGEAFTGVANDANAIFFNPAGLGQDPLANSWKAFLESNGPFQAIASKHKSELLAGELVWAATPKGLQRYNGRMWESEEIYLVEQKDDLPAIARRFINVDDDTLINDIAWKIRKYNGIEMKRFLAVCAKLRACLKDSILANRKETIETLGRRIIELPAEERTSAKIHSILDPFSDSAITAVTAGELPGVLLTKDTELKDKVELRIPLSIAASDSVTALAMDESDRLWVGTTSGLWRCSESKWSRTTVADGLPSNFITSIAIGSYGDLALGTNAGVAIYKEGKWSTISTADGLPDSIITAVTFGKDNTLFIGTGKGLAKKNDSSLTLFDTTNGLLSEAVHALFHDSKNRLWIGGDNGVTILAENTWKRFKFPGSTVRSFTEQHSGAIWIGTGQGVVSYREGKIKTSKSGTTIQQPPEWKAYHSKNALRGDDVKGLAAFGNDVWVATDKAINKYEWAEKQALLFYEPLLPAFHLKELWHTFGAFVLPTEDWGTLGFSINFINMGINEWSDELGRALGKARSWEGIFGLSYGFTLTQTFSLGLNVKYVNSALAPGIGKHGAGVGTTYAIDAAFLKRDLLVRNLCLGFMFQNMGPAIYYIDPDKSDPIPFTLRLGTAYTPIQTPIHELTVLLDFNREVVKSYNDRKPDPFYVALWTDLLNDKDESPSVEAQLVNVNLGLEYWYSHFCAIRSGFLVDYVGERYELTMGLGLNYGNMNFDWSYIHSPEGFMGNILEKINPQKTGSSGARHGQWRASFLFRL